MLSGLLLQVSLVHSWPDRPWDWSGVGVATYSSEHYTVQGEDLLEVATSILRDTPMPGYIAYTRGVLSARYDLEDLGDGSCALTKGSVDLEVHQVFPVLRHAGNDELAAEWWETSQELYEHEMEHVRYAWLAGKQMWSAVSIRWEGPCDDLEEGTDWQLHGSIRARDYLNSTVDARPHKSRLLSPAYS